MIDTHEANSDVTSSSTVRVCPFSSKGLLISNEARTEATAMKRELNAMCLPGHILIHHHYKKGERRKEQIDEAILCSPDWKLGMNAPTAESKTCYFWVLDIFVQFAICA